MGVVVAFPARRDPSTVDLTKRQLAQMWGVSTRWIELAHRDEGLPSVGIFGGRRIFRLSEVETWKRGQTA